MRKLLAGGIILLLVGVSVPSTTTMGLKYQEPELIIEGPKEGKVGVPYNYTFYLTEQEGCEIYYKIDWDDGNKTEWLGPYESSEKLELTHTWYESDYWYNIFAEAKGCNGSKYSAKYWVSITTTLYVGGSKPNNYTKIQDAVNDARYGDTVFVYDDSSPYLENIVIHKTINLLGENKETTIIDGCQKGHVVQTSGWPSVDGVRISNFTLQNSTERWFHMIYYAIEFSESENCIITDNIIKDSIGSICCCSCSNTIISNNIVINNEYGLDLYECYNSIISHNIIENNSLIGVYLYGENNIIADNIIKDNGGINYLPPWGPGPGWWAYGGIHLVGCKNNSVYHNRISGGFYGIYMGGSSSGNDIYENNIINNKIGIKLYGGCKSNMIFHNNFIINIISAHFSRFSCFNKWDGNYWNRPRLLPKLIVGSIGMIVPSWVNFDWHPAQKPYDIEV